MAGEIFEKFYDPDDSENYWADMEPKTTKNLYSALTAGLSTKNESEILKELIKTQHSEDMDLS